MVVLQVSPTGNIPIKKTSKEGKALALVTYIGCSISIVCLSLTLLVLLIFRYERTLLITKNNYRYIFM